MLKPKLYTYAVVRDFGFAPNPYFGYCTLATCKPVIRRCAKVGDWIAGFGASCTPCKQKLVFLMLVEETMTFNQYWDNPRFKMKKPVRNRSGKYAYGDNIYHNENGQWVQEFSHHSYSDGTTNRINLDKDTNTNRVVVSKTFYYFGHNAIDLPEEFQSIICIGRGHRTIRNDTLITALVQYISDQYSKGMQGTPFSIKPGKMAHYGGKS